MKTHIEIPGLRILKTVIAVFIVMIIATLSNGALQRYEMVIVAILAIQGDVVKSLKEVKTRIASTLIGGIIGTIAMCIMYIGKSDILNISDLIPICIFLI